MRGCVGRFGTAHSAMGPQVRRYSKVMNRAGGDNVMDVRAAFSSRERPGATNRLCASGLCDMPNGFPFLPSYRGGILP